LQHQTPVTLLILHTISQNHKFHTEIYPLTEIISAHQILLTTTPRFLHQLLHPLLTPAHLPLLLRTLRHTLFPNLTLPPPSPPPPSAPQRLAIKRTCAIALLDLLPPFLLTRCFPGLSDDERVREVEHELDVWGDAYLNKHLLYAVVELVLVRVLPEVGERGVREGLEGRGVGVS